MRGLLPLVVVVLLLSGCLNGAKGGGSADVADAPLDRGLQPSDPGTTIGTDRPSEPSAAAKAGTMEIVVQSDQQVTPPANLSLMVVRLPFHIEANGAKGGIMLPPPSYPNYGNLFYLNATGATALLLELAWNSTMYDLDPELSIGPSCHLISGDPGPTCYVQAAYAHWLDEGDDGNYWVKGGSFGNPDGPVRLLIGADPMRGYGCDDWCSAIPSFVAKDAAFDVTGQLVVSLFYGVDVPEGYTALR